MSNATVNIVDAEPKAEKVRADSIKAGDFVFSTFGKPSKVTEVKTLKDGCVVVKSGLWPMYADPDVMVTIIRS